MKNYIYMLTQIALIIATNGCSSPFDGTVITKERVSIAGHKDRVRCLAFAPDGKTLASGSEDGAVKIWDTSTWQLVRSIDPKLDKPPKVMAVAYSPDGKKLAVGRAGGPFDIFEDDRSSALGSNDEHVWDISFSPDGRHVATVTAKHVTIWDVATGATLQSLPDSAYQGWCVAFSPDGTKVASGGFGRETVRLTDLGPPIASTDFGGRFHFARSLAFFRDGKTLAVGGDFVCLHDVNNGQETALLRGHNAHSTSIAISKDEAFLVSAGAAGEVKVWDIAKKTVWATYRGSPREQLWAIALSPDDKTLVSGTDKGNMKVWDMVK